MINRVLSFREIVLVLVVDITIIKPNTMKRLDRINLIIQPKVQNYQNTFETTSINVLQELSFQMFQKCKEQAKLRRIVYFSMET